MFLTRLLATIGIVASLYLASVSLSGSIDTIVGCSGNMGNCSAVLGSRWSQFFGIPVTVFSLAVYLAALGLTFLNSKQGLLGLAVALILAAVWFSGIQLFVLGAFCTWCMGLHAIGLTTAASIFWSLKANWQTSRRANGPVILVATSLMVCFALGQVFGPAPQTHLVSDTLPREKQPSEDLEVPIHARGEGRIVDFDGEAYCISSLPHIGSVDAPYVLIQYYDYTCKACKRMELALARLESRYPGQFVVIFLPSPLDRRCNQCVPENLKDHGYACDYAQFALAAWRARPDRFAAAHRQLFTRPIVHPSIMRQSIEKIIAPEKLSDWLADPWISELLHANAEDFKLLIRDTVKLPKIRTPHGKVLSGVVADFDELVDLLQSKAQ